MHRHALRAEEQFGGAQHVRIIALIERVTQDEVHQLIEKDWRNPDTLAHQRRIRRFERAMAGQTVAERDHELPVLARVGFRNGVDLRRRNGSPWVGQQCGMQGAFDDAGLGRWRELRPRQIDLHEFVGHAQPAVLIAIEQVMTAGQPEIFHGALTAADPRSPDRAMTASPALAASGRRSTTVLSTRRTRRSPLSSISRRTPFSGATRDK